MSHLFHLVNWVINIIWKYVNSLIILHNNVIVKLRKNDTICISRKDQILKVFTVSV